MNMVSLLLNHHELFRIYSESFGILKREYVDDVTKTNLDSWQLLEQTETQIDDTDGDMESNTEYDEAASATDIDSDDSDDTNSTADSRLSSTEDEDTE